MSYLHLEAVGGAGEAFSRLAAALSDVVSAVQSWQLQQERYRRGGELLARHRRRRHL